MILAAEVAKLKCIYFNAVRMVVELELYGIKCNYDSMYRDIELARDYLTLVLTECELDETLECKISAFIKNRYDFCVRMFDPCEERITEESCTGEDCAEEDGGGGIS